MPVTSGIDRLVDRLTYHRDYQIDRSSSAAADRSARFSCATARRGAPHRPARLPPRRRCASSSTSRGRSSPRPGIPVTKHGFAKTADEARRIAEQIGGPVVIKSQVLTGGRMKAGGVQFADTPDEAAQHAEHVLDLEINGHMPRGVLVDYARRRRARVLRRRRLGRDPQAAGDAVLRHGRDRHRAGRRGASRPRRPRGTSRPARRSRTGRPSS